MDTKVLLLKADVEPLQGIINPSPNQIYKNARISIEDRVLNDLDPNEIRVEMIYVGICGTDVHMSTNNNETGYICSTAPMSIPEEGRIIGHEGVGKIIGVGSNVTYLTIGMVVTFESIIVCNVCDVCRRGAFNQCRNAKLLGLEKDGLLGTVVDVPAKLAHNITDFVRNENDLIAAACIEPAGVAYVACENAQISGGDIVAIFGGGPIGLFTAILSKLVFGASEVHLIEPVEFRRTFAKRWADKVYSAEEFFTDGPANIDVVIESSGYLKNVEKSFGKINANGRVIFLARSGESVEISQVDHMITNAIKIQGSRGHLCGAFKNVLNLHKAGRINLEDIVTCVANGLQELKMLLEERTSLFSENCKVVVKLKN